ncbi:MAG: ABC transporter permease [Clostridia bacterium]|nr:ABC transporter permease [Clostridia bacterium]
MNIKQSFILAMKSLKASKMRSFLTMLGIIIGVAAVIVLVSIVDGFSNTMLDAFESAGLNIVNVNVRGRGSSRTVDPDDMITFAEDNDEYIIGISPSVMASVTLKVDTENNQTTVTGVNEYYKDIKELEMGNGRFLQYIDVERRQKVCVIGSYIAKNYFGTLSCVGEKMKINGNDYTVVGILNESAESEEGSADDIVYIPYTCATLLSRQRTVSPYVVAATSKDDVTRVKRLVENYLYSVFDNSDLYTVTAVADLVDTVDELMGTLTGILVGIAGISLLVGGIGIMNIMLVSVTERTREIGIRKSLGAKPWDIMSQFVVEAATTSSMGGFIGIAFGCIASIVAGKILGVNATPSVLAILVAFTVSVAIGMFFGYFPAKKASKLNPIDALRYD